jgi:hypothetical protein
VCRLAFATALHNLLYAAPSFEYAQHQHYSLRFINCYACNHQHTAHVNYRPQTDIIMYDENHVNLDLLHENGVHAVPLNEHTFDVWLQEHEYTFVDFYAPW